LVGWVEVSLSRDIERSKSLQGSQLSTRTGNSSGSLTAEVDSSVPAQVSLVRQPVPKGGQNALVRSAAFAGLGDAG